jgi:hypothetical protein
MLSSSEKRKLMQNTDNQVAVDKFLSWRSQSEDLPFSILEYLGHLEDSRGNGQHILDRVLDILSIKYDAHRDSNWAKLLRPFTCRLLGYTVGSAFTRAFATKIRIPFDGCYFKEGRVGRADEFIASFGNFVRYDQKVRGSLDPKEIKELVFYQDPQSTRTGRGMPLRKIQSKLAWSLSKRLEEDEELTKGWCNTALERRRLYDKIYNDALEDLVNKKFRYNHHKVAVLWLGIIDLLQLLPNLETFRPVIIIPTSRLSY